MLWNVKFLALLQLHRQQTHMGTFVQFVERRMREENSRAWRNFYECQNHSGKRWSHQFEALPKAMHLGRTRSGNDSPKKCQYYSVLHERSAYTQVHPSRWNFSKSCEFPFSRTYGVGPQKSPKENTWSTAKAMRMSPWKYSLLECMYSGTGRRTTLYITLGKLIFRNTRRRRHEMSDKSCLQGSWIMRTDFMFKSTYDYSTRRFQKCTDQERLKFRYTRLSKDVIHTHATSSHFLN